MPAHLLHDGYGKSRVRLTKVTRLADRNELKELSVDIQLEGDFSAAFVDGDNRKVIATDSMKNTVYALARSGPVDAIEDFAVRLTQHFLREYPQVANVAVSIREDGWSRLDVGGRPHPYAFARSGAEERTCEVFADRKHTHVESGFDGLLLMKTRDSGFSNFVRDRFTTLKDTDDRLFATILEAQWSTPGLSSDWSEQRAQVRAALLSAFANHRSLSVQHTLYAMGQAALDACSGIERISLAMPNQHRLLVDLKPLGLDNPNEIFVPTDEPHGMISATLERDRG